MDGVCESFSTSKLDAVDVTSDETSKWWNGRIGGLYFIKKSFVVYPAFGRESRPHRLLDVVALASRYYYSVGSTDTVVVEGDDEAIPVGTASDLSCCSP